jgi:hypothetical protein
VLGKFLGLLYKVFQVGKNDVREIMEGICHFMLEIHADFFDSKGHDTIRKGTRGGYEGGFVLIQMVDLDMVIAKNSFHEGEDFMDGTGINELINEGGREVFFGIILVEVAEVYEKLNGGLFLIDRDMIGDLGCICNGVYESNFMDFFDLHFDLHGIERVEGAFLLVKRGHIGPSVNAMFNNRWV